MRKRIGLACTVLTLWGGEAHAQWIVSDPATEAMTAAQRIARTEQVALLGICSGGMLASMVLGHLAAVGYSSARPVLIDGAEDPAASRRVVFSVGLDDQGLLREVEGEVAAGLGAARPGEGASQ